MGNTQIDRIRLAVEGLHNCRATYLNQTVVIEKFGNKAVWNGIVYIFRLEGSEHSDKCYAWRSDNPKTGKMKYYAVLHIPPVDSPEKAVRASVVKDYKDQPN